MKESLYFIIRFNDLKEDVQNKIKDSVRTHLEGEKYHEYLFEVCGSDPYDMDKPDTDRIAGHIEGCVERACDKAWVEMEVEVRL